MAKLELNNTGVLFNEKEHTYWLGDKQLFGITDVIKRNIECAKKEYDNCPDFLIKRAGEYGTGCHHRISRLINDFEHDGTVEVQDFIELTKDMQVEKSEYNVFDGGNHYSSNIDVVFRVNDDTFDLADIKTYAGKLTKTQRIKAQWQLNIYSFLFRITNPEAKVRDLFVIHIRNKAKKDGTMDHQAEILPVDVIPDSIIKELLECDLNGTTFHNPYDIPKEVSSKIGRIIKLMDTKKKTEEELNAIKKEVYDTMLFLDQTSWQTPEIRFTRTADSTRSSFDLKAFQKDHPNFDYNSYMKVSPVAGSLRIAV